MLVHSSNEYIRHVIKTCSRLKMHLMLQVFLKLKNRHVLDEARLLKALSDASRKTPENAFASSVVKKKLQDDVFTIRNTW